MSIIKRKKRQVLRRKMRVRKNIRQAYDNSKIRVSVFRSLCHIYGQAIDYLTGNTILSASTKDIIINDEAKKNKTALSYDAGVILGKRLLDSGYTEIVFDRGSYLYHGRVKAFSDGIRASGVIC